jgi:hypothetical protein
VIVAERVEETDLVVTVKVALVLPAATVIEAGTVAEALLLEIDILAPPEGATPVKVTVPVAELPPVTLEGLTETDDNETVPAGVMASAAVLLTPLYVPVIVAETEDVTDLVVTVNVAVVAPAATVTEAGTVAEALLLESATLTPPEGAVLFKVTVPVAEVPPVTLEGLMDSDDKESVADGVMVSAADLLTPL